MPVPKCIKGIVVFQLWRTTNDHVKGCPEERGTSVLPVCKKCGGKGHTQENCIATGVPCYKCGQMGHLAGECTQMGRFALRHQIYDPPPSENNQFSRNNCKEGDQQVNSYAVSTDKSREGGEMDRYHQAYRELQQRDPIASIDETTTEYPSQDYRQLNKLIEERRYSKQQTPRRELDKRKYQPRRLAELNEIELGLP